MQYLANYITASRFVFAALLVLSEPFSVWFWVWYACGGISDLIDGPVARKLKQQSAFGAKLDSAADLVFIACACVAVLRGVSLPAWGLAGIGAIAAVRIAAYIVGFHKFHTFAAIHTWLNKATGALLLVLPVLYQLLGIAAAFCIVGGVGLAAAAEELALVIRSKELDRDRKSIFSDKKPV